MTLIAGLGNIGREYENTRHNVGFMLADLLIKDLALSPENSTKFKGELFKKGSLLIVKPSTFMNKSGECILAVRDFYKPEKIIVFHDDLDLPFGAVRFKNGGSSGGHNGIKSIDAMIGNDYDRVRIGIGRSEQNGVVGYVLGKFNEFEKEKLGEILAHAKQGVLGLLNGEKITEISSKFNTKPSNFGL